MLRDGAGEEGGLLLWRMEAQDEMTTTMLDEMAYTPLSVLVPFPSIHPSSVLYIFIIIICAAQVRVEQRSQPIVYVCVCLMLCALYDQVDFLAHTASQ